MKHKYETYMWDHREAIYELYICFIYETYVDYIRLDIYAELT